MVALLVGKKKKYHVLGGLKQQKYILSSFWSLEVGHLGVVMLSLEALGEHPFSPLLFGGC